MEKYLEKYAILLQAIATLLWPLFAFTTLFLFRSEITDIARRLKKGKLLGQEIELNESLDLLDKSALSIEQNVTSFPEQINEKNQILGERIIEEIISEAARSPKVALIHLASELEKIARQILASSGFLQGRSHITFSKAIAELNEIYGLPRHIPNSLNFFWEARNRLIHKGEGTDEDILRAIDSGLTILKALQAIPREINIVKYANISLFSNPELTEPIVNFKGIILEALTPGGTTKKLKILPTTQTYFEQGRQVSWEWNMEKICGKAWYRDPETKESMCAFLEAAEFTGRHIDDI
jgi:hypothetical protein